MSTLEGNVTMPSSTKAHNIEEIIQEIYNNVSGDHSKNIEAFEKHYRRANQTKIEHATRYAFYGNRRKGITGANESAEEAIDAIYKDGKVDIEKEENLHKVAISYMKRFFQNSRPSTIEAIKEAHPELKKALGKEVSSLSKEEAKKLYETLAHHFDLEVGAGQVEDVKGIGDLVDIVRQNFKDEEEVTAEMLGDLFVGLAEGHRKGAYAKLNTHAMNAYIAHLPSGVYAAHVLKRARRRGADFEKAEDAAKLLSQSPVTLASDIHLPIIQRNYDNIKLAKHGLYIKEEKKK